MKYNAGGYDENLPHPGLPPDVISLNPDVNFEE